MNCDEIAVRDESTYQLTECISALVTYNASLPSATISIIIRNLIQINDRLAKI